MAFASLLPKPTSTLRKNRRNAKLSPSIKYPKYPTHKRTPIPSPFPKTHHQPLQPSHHLSQTPKRNPPPRQKSSNRGNTRRINCLGDGLGDRSVMWGDN